jgi:valyl-tRNA synthetase
MLAKQYNPNEAEPRWMARWQEMGVYHFLPDKPGPVFSVDTPPPTVSGNLHLGHVYSYSHADFVARFWRMNGRRVFYPMGYDDNGLPTERLVEKRLGITALQVGRSAFIEKCLQVSEDAEREYQHLWQRLGLSIDWRYTYRTIDAHSRRTSQLSFIDLYQKGLAYRREAPAIWCPECRTSIAQAELSDLDRKSEFITLAFHQENGDGVPVATTRPELLPACVAVFVHPEDRRYRNLTGKKLRVPLFEQIVPVLVDPGVDPEKGTGAVMCCTFGDSTDVTWWYTYHLPLIESIDQEGRMTQIAGRFSGLPVAEARRGIIAELDRRGQVLGRQPTIQSVRVHERCDTPVEYIIARQWFIRVLDHKSALLRAGEQVAWHPEHMQARYRAWVENLNWDWCISRQRYYGVAFPVWYCQACGQVNLAKEDRLPVDPTVDSPDEPCTCGNTSFIPETDIMDTWATSSLSPQIVGQWLGAQEGLYEQVFPFSLRPQAHEIIRTWAFYTIVKSQYHFGALPWKSVLISGWGIAGEGMGKISKSRGGGPMPPLEMIERYSADAVRYWAASTGPGKDATISEEKIQLGVKLVTKLWNVARFSERFFIDVILPFQPKDPTDAEFGMLSQMMTPADRWILARLQRLIQRVSELFQEGEYATAKSEIENFFWGDLADNYIEMAKQRLYDSQNPQFEAARRTLYHVLLATVKLFAPFLPYISEEIYQGLFFKNDGAPSIHVSAWPSMNSNLDDPHAIEIGERLVTIATAVRRYKSEHNLPLGSEIVRLELASAEPSLVEDLHRAVPDLCSVTRARIITFAQEINPALAQIYSKDGCIAAITSPG